MGVPAAALPSRCSGLAHPRSPVLRTEGLRPAPHRGRACGGGDPQNQAQARSVRNASPAAFQAPVSAKVRPLAAKLQLALPSSERSTA